MLLPYAAFLLLFGPLPEEMGWRGYALGSLQAKYGALVSSLILGTGWAAWHLPLFFMTGTYQHGLGISTLNFWLFMIAMLPETVLMTWIFNNNRQSTLSAAFFHMMINMTGELTALSSLAETTLVILWVVLAMIVCAIYGPKAMIIKSRQSSLKGDHK